MDTVQSFFGSYWAYLIPALIVTVLYFFLRKRRVSDSRLRMLVEREHYLRMRSLDEFGAKEPETPSPIRQLLLRDDVTLRLLEEVNERPSRYMRRSWGGSADSIRLHALDSLESELQSFLRESVNSNEFPQIRDRSLALLDEIRTEKSQLQQKEPFNDISDPEKSLLIDIFYEIDASKTVIRQKAIQLSNIIKIKHQDILKLQAENARAGRWTRWGTAGTVFFGILSLVLSFISIRSATGGA